MDLQATLNSAIDRLATGKLTDEAKIKQAVIVPILRSLGWDDSDPESLLPEYSVDHGRVDYALLHLGCPMVFIEAKREGGIEAKGEEQLFNYASNQGIPLLVLSDGNRWDFYLSMAAGIPSERRFFRLELKQESKSADYVKFLETHLSRAKVITGEAQRSAQELHTSNTNRRRAEREIPEAWHAMLEKPEEMLRDLLAEEVESRCESMPDLEVVESFLRSLATRVPVGAQKLHERKKVPQPLPGKTPRTGTKRSKILGFEYAGERVETGTASGTLAEILNRFHELDPNFMGKFAIETATKKRMLVAKSRDELYPASPHLIESSRSLADGGWLGTHLNTAGVMQRILKACEISGVKFGTQLKLIE